MAVTALGNRAVKRAIEYRRREAERLDKNPRATLEQTMTTETGYWVLRWRMRRGREVPVVEKASQREIRYTLHRTTKRAVIESALKACRKALEKARESVAANEQYVQDLERMLEKETK